MSSATTTATPMKRTIADLIYETEAPLQAAKRYKATEVEQLFLAQEANHGLKQLLLAVTATTTSSSSSSDILSSSSSTLLPPPRFLFPPTFTASSSPSSGSPPLSPPATPPSFTFPSTATPSLFTTTAATPFGGSSPAYFASLLASAAAAAAAPLSPSLSPSLSPAPSSPRLSAFTTVTAPTPTTTAPSTTSKSSTPTPSSTSTSSSSTSSGSSSQVTCYYPAVAQKSYGNEKRFLCPPPTVVFSSSCQSVPTSVSTAVRCDDAPVTAPITTASTVMVEDRKASFKSLHVNSLTGSKSFSLQVTLDSTVPAVSFATSQITILSKPSKKTLKAKTDASVLCSGSLVALYNRIHSQTVRTKFIALEQGKLCARNSTWTPFTIYAVSPAGEIIRESVPLLYGQEVILCDLESNFTSEPFFFHRLDKGFTIEAPGAPLTHLQKIALQAKVTSDFLGLSPANSTSFESSDPLLSYQTPLKSTTPGQITLTDLAGWSIVGIEKTTVTI